MLTVTEAAGGYLSSWLERANATDDTAVRLFVEPKGLAAALDTERPGDTTIEHAGRRVLLLDEEASQALSERTLDVQRTPDGPRLGIK
jgi:Fe-S cluster assembly iron-binding protein IscA